MESAKQKFEEAVAKTRAPGGKQIQATAPYHNHAAAILDTSL